MDIADGPRRRAAIEVRVIEVHSTEVHSIVLITVSGRFLSQSLYGPADQNLTYFPKRFEDYVIAQPRHSPSSTYAVSATTDENIY